MNNKQNEYTKYIQLCRLQMPYYLPLFYLVLSNKLKHAGIGIFKLHN